jgi:glutathione peroxidase
MHTLYDIKAANQDAQNEFLFSSLENKVTLVVITASLSSYSKQLNELQAIYQKNQAQGLEIIAIPSGNFSFFTSGDQELNGNPQIKQYYHDFYHITFPILDKADKHSPLLQFFAQQDKPVFKLGYQNFTKYLFDKNGQFIKRFTPQTNLNKVEDFLRQYL